MKGGRKEGKREGVERKVEELREGKVKMFWKRKGKVG